MVAPHFPRIRAGNGGVLFLVPFGAVSRISALWIGE
jgi:hypothetical protein